MSELPQRQRLYHIPPEWVDDDAIYFVTVCCARRGVTELTRSDRFDVMSRAIEQYECAGKWHMLLFLAMPDHWHALIRFPEPGKMEKVLKDWKRYIAKHSGIVWQDGFFDHRLRTRQSAEEKWHYIWQNPVRMGFVSSAAQWPYFWLPDKTAR